MREAGEAEKEREKVKDYCWKVHTSTHGQTRKGFLKARNWHEAKHLAVQDAGVPEKEWVNKGVKRQVWLMPIGSGYMTLELR